MKSLPIDAEARGKVRRFRETIAASAAAIRAALAAPDVHRDIESMCTKGKVGRERAIARIRARMKGVYWHRTADPAVMLGAYLDVSAKPIILEPRDPGQTQTGVVVSYLLIATDTVDRSHNYWHGLWTFEIPDHALGRIVQRDRRADLGAVLFAAHKEALLVALDQISLDHGKEFYIATPPNGVFLCQFILGPDVATYPNLNAYIRPRTWLLFDQLRDEQQAAQHGKPTLGHTLLLPHPAKDLKFVGNTLHFRQKPLGIEKFEKTNLNIPIDKIRPIG